MAQGPLITEEVRILIVKIYDEHRDWVAKEIQSELHRQLIIKYRSGVKEDWPALSTVQRELAKIHKSYAETPVYRSELPWSLGRLTDYNIPPEAIPKALEIQELRRDYEPLTIREAKWIGYLHAVIQDIMELAVWTILYAEREKLCERANIEKDTSDLDAAFRSKFITFLGYFPWLFQKEWVPDSYKKQVAGALTLKYENFLGLDLERRDFSVNGWLVYAHMLQSMVLFDKGEKDMPKKLQILRVTGARQIAMNEGRLLLGAPSKKYIDLVEAIKEGVVHEKSYSQIEEVWDVSTSREVKKDIDRLLGACKTRNEKLDRGGHT